jgi:hypothetical protein
LHEHMTAVGETIVSLPFESLITVQTVFALD